MHSLYVHIHVACSRLSDNPTHHFKRSNVNVCQNNLSISISKSIFPSIWKEGRISPITKIENPTDESHFRPVSILPVMSKVAEKLVAQQIVDYIEVTCNKSLKQMISGFCKGHSTTTVLLRIRDDIIRAMKKGELTLMVLADYSKAFDTVSYSVIIQKMCKMGFSKPFLSWMTNYLCDRRQYVQIDDKKDSGKTTVWCSPRIYLRPIAI